MKKLKSISVSMFLIILTIVNISVLSVNSSLLHSDTGSALTLDQLHVIAHNAFISNQSIEKAAQQYNERFNKYTSSFVNHFSLTANPLSDGSYFDTGNAILKTSAIVLPGLSACDIIFPFHYFW